MRYRSLFAGRDELRVVRAILILTVLSALTALGQGSFINFEGKQTSPIRLSPDGTRLFAVNTPDARLSVFDVTYPSNPFLIAEIPVGLEPISVNPRNNDEVWVVNEVSDSISIVSVSQRLVIGTLHVKDEPADVVFAGGKAFVSASRNNRISVFDATSRALLTNLAVFGENPRALAVSGDGAKVYAAFALSGNRTTIIPELDAPPQPTNGSPPMSPDLPPPPQAGLIVEAMDPAWTNIVKYKMPDHDVVEIDVASMTTNRHFSRVGTINLGLAVNPVSGDLYVANTEARNLVRFEPNLRAHSVDNRIARIAINAGTITNFDLNPGVDYSILPNLPALTNALAQPTAIVFDPGGAFMFVAAFGSDRIAKVDTNGAILSRIEIGPVAGSAADPRNKRGPRGLALHATGGRLYVLNRLANSISIVNTAGDTVLKEIPVGSFDPTPAAIRSGRGFLYDARLSGNGTMSCAACHVDAELDLIAWDLGDPTGRMQTNRNTLSPIPVLGTNVFHPMKGPMTTQTLRGLNTLQPFHWRGDRTNFLHFNGAFDSLMGGSALSGVDMAAYRDFVNTIVFAPNPNQNLDRTYPTNFAGGNAKAGRNAFLFTNYVAGLTCSSCHTAPPGPGSNRSITPAAAVQESQDFKVPHLRNIYQKMNFNRTAGASTIGGFGIIHDGADPTLQAFLSRPVFQNIKSNTTIKNNLSAFVQCFDTGLAPAVGYTRTVTLANVGAAAVSNDWSLLESQATVTNIQLIAKGTIDGQTRGLLFQPLSGTYRVDSTNLATFTRAQLVAKIQAGGTLNLMGVPPGSGTRMGIDRDQDGILDGDEPLPRVQVDLASNKAIVHWPLGPAGFAVEASPDLRSGPWSTATNPVEIVDGRNYLTNSISGNSFYRLRFTP